MSPLRIAILAQLDSPTITDELTPHLRNRGHIVDIINVSSASTEDFINQPDIKSLTKYDLVYYRSGLKPDDDPARIIKLEAYLRNNSIHTVNLHYTEHPYAHSKSYETKQAQTHGLTTPKSVYTKADFTSLSAQLGLPFILKTDQGTQGSGVHLIESETAFSHITALYPETQLLFQEFIPHDFEFRVFIVAGEVISFWKKTPAKGDFRSNEAQGGKMMRAGTEHLEQLSSLALATYTAFGFEIFVADFMLDKHTNTFYFTEINLNPGWATPDNQAAGVDHSKVTADYFEKICS